MSINKQLPHNWTSATLKDVAEIITGNTPPTSNRGFYGGSIPFIKPPSLKDGPIVDVEETISVAGMEHTRIIPMNTVLVSCIGNLGKTGLTTRQSAFNQQINAVVFDPIINPRFGFYACQLLGPFLESVASATTISIVNKSKFSNAPIPIAPLSEQTRIVAEIEKHLTRLDVAVSALKRIKANLKRYRASVLKAACEGRLVPTEAELAKAEGRDYEPADHLLSRILKERRAKWEADQLAKMKAQDKTHKDDKWKDKYEEPVAPDTNGLSELTDGWMWARAEQLCDFITKGTTPDKRKLFSHSGQIPFIKVYNLTHHGALNFNVNPTFINEETHLGELARSRVFPGDVLMNIVGPPLGKVSIVPDAHEEWNINQAIAVFRPMPSYDRKFLSFSLLADHVLAWAKRRAKATAGQFNLTLEICRDLPLPLPPHAEQRRIVAEVERHISIIEELETVVEANLTRAERLRQSILKRAFEGKLVPQDPNDEPASNLLERIRAEREKKLSGVKASMNKRRAGKTTQPELNWQSPEEKTVSAHPQTDS